MKAKATVHLRFSSQKQIAALLEALAPEASSPMTRRAKVVLRKEGAFLLLRVEAEDTVALRATLNAYLRWVSSTMNVLEVVAQS